MTVDTQSAQPEKPYRGEPPGLDTWAARMVLALWAVTLVAIAYAEIASGFEQIWAAPDWLRPCPAATWLVDYAGRTGVAFLFATAMFPFIAVVAIRPARRLKLVLLAGLGITLAVLFVLCIAAVGHGIVHAPEGM